MVSNVRIPLLEYTNHFIRRRSIGRLVRRGKARNEIPSLEAIKWLFQRKRPGVG